MVRISKFFSRALRSASSAQAAGPGPNSGAPAAAPSSTPASAPSAAQGASAPGGAAQFQEKLAFFRRWRRLHALDFVSQASNSDFPLTELGRFILLLDDRGSNASRFGADGAAREADPYAQLQVWEELAISILRTSAGGTAVAITATPRLLEGLVLPYTEACAPVISPSAVVRELVDAKAHNEGATRHLDKGVRFTWSGSNESRDRSRTWVASARPSLLSTRLASLPSRARAISSASAADGSPSA